jgi:signal transduction histidine kinase
MPDLPPSDPPAASSAPAIVQPTRGDGEAGAESKDTPAAPAGEALPGGPLLEAIPEAALVLDGAGTVRAANGRARLFLGGGENAAIEGRPLRDLVGLPDDLPALGPGELAGRLSGPDGRRVAIVLGPLPAPASGLVALLRDRTAEERSFQLRLTREKLEAISQLAAGVAHEYNNIMASLYGFAQLARQDPQFQRELIEAVEHSADRSREVTRRLRSLSPEQFAPLVPIDVANLIDGVLARHAPALARAQIELVRRFEGSLPQTIGARAELDEVFDALVENARLSIVKNGEITIEARRDGSAILVSVRDSGFGIPRENLTRVFEPFFVTKAAENGTVMGGLGLAVAYSHVRRHGGEIWVESELGRGTTFFVRLPVRAERRRRQLDVPVERRRPARTARAILAIDDEEAMLRLLESILAGHRVSVARTGREAMAMLGEGPFDYVVLDLILKGELDGFAVFDEISKRERDAKIILLTGRAEDEKQRDYAARAYGYLKKPFGIKDIQSLIV